MIDSEDRTVKSERTMSTQTRQKLVEAAVRRFYRDGFRNVGIDQVIDDVGISKTAFYKHFESKDDLMLAALEMQNQWLQETFHAMIRESGGASPIAATMLGHQSAARAIAAEAVSIHVSRSSGEVNSVSASFSNPAPPDGSRGMASTETSTRPFSSR